jgi:hypothetical protein
MNHIASFKVGLSRALIFASTGLVGLGTSSSARADTVTALTTSAYVLASTGDTGVVTTITGGPANTNITLTSADGVAAYTFKTDASGNATTPGILKEPFSVNQAKGVLTLTYTDSKGVTQTFFTKEGVTAAGKGLTSKEEGGKSTALLFIRDDSGVSAFASTSVFFDQGGDGALTDQFDLTNSSSNSYLITSLDLYQNLSTSFFSQAAFDTPAAIASGTLFDDIVADGGTFSLGPGGELMLAITPLNLTGYDLLTGTAQLENPNGSLGAPFTFSFADVTPEPPTGVLLGTGIGAIAMLRRLLIRKQKPRTIEN